MGEDSIYMTQAHRNMFFSCSVYSCSPTSFLTLSSGSYSNRRPLEMHVTLSKTRISLGFNILGSLNSTKCKQRSSHFPPFLSKNTYYIINCSPAAGGACDRKRISYTKYHLHVAPEFLPGPGRNRLLDDNLKS